MTEKRSKWGRRELFPKQKNSKYSMSIFCPYLPVIDGGLQRVTSFQTIQYGNGGGE